MKKTLIALVAAVFLTAGTASADRGFWFGGNITGGNAAGWSTFMNITNYSASDANVTVTFYDIAGSLIGSTTRVVASNATWNFHTGGVGTINASSFDTCTACGGAERGAVNITSNQGKNVVGYTSIFGWSSGAGFNFRVPDLVENP